MTLRALSHGGGVQTTALHVLAGLGELQVDVALFSNVGDDSEHPDTIRYVREIMAPWGEAHGVPLMELRAEFQVGERKGQPRTLLTDLLRDDVRSIGIPIRMANGAPGTRRCTGTFKIHVVSRELRRRGATKADPADLMIGISTDEIERARGEIDPHHQHYRRRYPLLDLGLSRSDCESIIHRAGLPIPPKSACWFCPYHRPSRWAEMRRDEPELFAQAVELEATLNVRRQSLGRDPAWLTRFNMPLDQAVEQAPPSLFDGIGEAGCDEGVCFV
jgi:hypothetical protein